MAKIYGRAISVPGGVVPSIFGDGSDGDLIVRTGETFTIPVPVPHQSVVEKQYNSILIEAGGTLTCSDPNAGLVLRCKGDCTIQGTIDQRCKSPKTNPNNTYGYPSELVCGKGGDGGQGTNTTINGGSGSLFNGGTGMAARPYGGGYSAGGAGSAGSDGRGYSGGSGGSVDTVTIDILDSQMFVGGKGSATTPSSGQYGGGGGAHGYYGSSSGGDGGNGPGGNTTNPPSVKAAGNGGGAGNIGGGVVLLYVNGALSLEGTIDCSGGDGGSGVLGDHIAGGGGGGAGGGAIYIIYNGTISNTANLNVNGGAAGSGNTNIIIDKTAEAGGLGSITIKQYEKGMTA